MAVAFHLVAHGAHHLAVADIASFAPIDFATCDFQRRIGAHSLYLLDGVVEVEQRHDLHDPTNTNADHKEAENQQQRGVAFNRAVFVKKSHFRALSLFSGHCGTGIGRLALCRAGHSFPQVVAHDDRTGEEQRPAQTAPTYIGNFAATVSAKEFTRKPCASTSRHIRPSMMPVTHMDAA